MRSNHLHFIIHSDPKLLCCFWFVKGACYSGTKGVISLFSHRPHSYFFFLGEYAVGPWWGGGRRPRGAALFDHVIHKAPLASAPPSRPAAAAPAPPPGGPGACSETNCGPKSPHSPNAPCTEDNRSPQARPRRRPLQPPPPPPPPATSRYPRLTLRGREYGL